MFASQSQTNKIPTTMKLTIDDVRSRFQKHFDGSTGSVYAAPGRINIIGEHTDYNDGFVFPGAVSQGVIAELKPNGTRKVRAYAIDLKDYVEFSLDDEKGPTATHFRFVYGVCREMMKLGVPVEGFNTAFAGDVPLGAGMSSSAALESCFAFALNDLFGNNSIDKFTLAKVGQATEHKYIGCNCGIMDQFASIFGKPGHIMRLDCRSLELKSLRDANYELVDEVRGEVSKEDALRAHYVIGEKERVMEVSAALEKEDYEEVGKKMYETHDGLSREYEVSCPELDFLVDVARDCGVSGARVMGGGFGGCTINLVSQELYANFIDKARKSYQEKFGKAPIVIDVVIGDGARKLC